VPYQSFDCIDPESMNSCCTDFQMYWYTAAVAAAAAAVADLKYHIANIDYNLKKIKMLSFKYTRTTCGTYF